MQNPTRLYGKSILLVLFQVKYLLINTSILFGIIFHLFNILWPLLRLKAQSPNQGCLKSKQKKIKLIKLS